MSCVHSLTIYIYIYSSLDERIQRKQRSQYCKRRAMTVKVTLTSARCDTVFHIRQWRRWSSDRCRGRLGSVFISFYIVAIDVDGLTWRQVDTSNLRFNCVGGFTWLSNISTFSSRHKLHNPDRRWQVLDWRSFFTLWWCARLPILEVSIYILTIRLRFRSIYFCERLYVIVVPSFDVVFGHTYVAWCVGFCFYFGDICNIIN